ncbi:MAG: hypothetical protein HN853_11420 [Halieaceae bacterium]|nr:hypothetical protein [Halieaceae bacterium]
MLSIDLFEVMKPDCATSPLFAPVLFDGDSAQATRLTNSVDAIDGAQAMRHCTGRWAA